MKRLCAIILSCALLAIVYVAVGLDDWLGASRSILFELAFLALGLIFGVSAFVLGEHKAFLIFPALYIVFILALPLLELSPVKPAVRIVHEIRPGMTETAVRSIIDRHFPAHGRFKRPEIGTLHEDVLAFVLDPQDGRYNASLVQIKFAAGKCVSAEFFPD